MARISKFLIEMMMMRSALY